MRIWESIMNCQKSQNIQTSKGSVRSPQLPDWWMGWPALGKALGLLLAVVLWGWGLMPEPAMASLHPYPLSGDRVLCRSLQSLRDQRDRSWQLVLFGEAANGQPPTTGFRLRVVGFPSLRVNRDRSLIVTNSTGAVAQLADQFPIDSLALNTGEYEFDSVAGRLNQLGILRLTIPVGDADQAEIPVPPFVLQEWKMLQKSGCPKA